MTPGNRRALQNYLLFTLSLFTLFLSETHLYAKPLNAKATAKKSTAPASTSQPADPSKKVIWDEWYTVTVGGKIHYGYYNEKVELRGSGQVFLKNEFWKQEEEYINREDLGVVAENDEALTPLFFNFHSVYRTTETVIDGNVKNTRFLSVRATRGGQELPIVQRTIPAKVFFSSLFPYWLGRQLPTLKEGAVKNFSTLMEDNLDVGFSPMEGQIRIEKPDETAIATKTKKIRVDSRGIRSWWWVDDLGAAVRIEMPEQKTVVTRTTKDIAKKFLDGTL